MRQTSFLPDVAPPTTRELIDKLARSNATPEQEPCDFGLFGERQLDIYRLLSKLVKGNGTKPGGRLDAAIHGCLSPRRQGDDAPHGE